MRGQSIRREVPFTMSLPQRKLTAIGQLEMKKSLSKVIDYFEDEQGLVLLDYKTDTITGRFANGMKLKGFCRSISDAASALYEGC
jgi:ATP-dependent helicase/nuclease subunit A